MLKSAPCPCLVFGSMLVQNGSMRTLFDDGNETNSTIKAAKWFGA